MTAQTDIPHDAKWPTKASSVEGVFVVALQPALSLHDYLNPDRFWGHLDALMAEALAERAGRPALVLLPEDIGTFLPLSRVPGASTARTLEEALKGAARASPLGLLRGFIRRPRGLRSVLLGSLGDTAFGQYHPGMQALARRHDTYLAAGSLLVRQKTPPSPNTFHPEGQDVYNVAPVYDPSGSVIAVSHKVNLVPDLETSLGLRAARPNVSPFRVGPLTMAVLICFDACTRSHVSASQPRFQPLWPLCDAQGVDVLLQPSANPAPWHAPWPYGRDGKRRTEETAWSEAAVQASLARSDTARYALTSFLTLRLFDLTFEGESRIFARCPDGSVQTLRRTGRYQTEQGDCAAWAVLT